MNIFAERMETLRALMAERGWDAVVLTGSDPFGSEYPAERWKQVQWLTGFTGEAGDVVVTANHAGLWTDTRYFIQAEHQLEGTGAVLHKTRVPDEVLIPEWLEGEFCEYGRTPVVAVDGLTVTPDFVDALPGRVESVPDLLSELWEDRPEVPQTPIMTVDSGESREAKLVWLRGIMEERGWDAVVLTALDDVAWTLNVRAMDIEYNPMVISCLLVTDLDAFWYVRRSAVEDEDPGTASAFSELAAAVQVMSFDGAVEDMTMRCAGLTVALDSRTVSFEMASAIGSSAGSVRMEKSPVQLRKAVKNPKEIEGMRRFHVLDGVVMEKFLWWVEKSMDAERQISEWDAAVKLGQLRAETDGYVCDSFGTISAYGQGAALPHYVTPNFDAPVLAPEGLYLCDSGGQYCDGDLLATTDITRTVPLGPLTELEREDYTLVLKGHVDLAMAVFPAGTAGCQIDALAREPLWRYHRLFGHGTGHGVGSFLGCHEGPADLRQNFNSQPLLPGMILSDEPGIYREGMHGVRHENLLLVVEDEENEFGRWLRFEPLTMCHFDTSELDLNLLDGDEIQYINQYNAKVRETLTPLLPEEVALWLAEKTKLI